MALRDHLEKLHYFYEVAKAGTFKEAAQRINITQPSLTKSIQVLENSIDKKLFQRLPRGVKLTTEGEVLYQYCHQFFNQLNDIEIKLNKPADPLAGSLRVGTYDSIAIYFWPDFLRSFVPKYPSLNIELTTDRSKNIQKKVESGELDVGLIIEPKENSQLKVIELNRDQFHLYQCKNINPMYEDLAQAPIIFMPDALAGKNHTPLLKTHELFHESSGRRLFKTSSLESAKELLLKGLGLAMLPKMVAMKDLENGLIEKVPVELFPAQGIGEHQLGLVYSKHNQSSQLLNTLIRELNDYDSNRVPTP